MTQRLINAIRKAKGAALALDKATLCVTLDVIGRVGFQKDFGATSNFEAVIEGKLPPPPGALSQETNQSWFYLLFILSFKN